jgi:hypothetical protein
MKKLKALLVAAFLIIAGNAFAQTTAPATSSPAKKEIKTKKDGSPDKRYTENQKLKKDGTADKRFTENKNLKKDGTPDKRFKTSKSEPVKAAKKKD